MFITTVCVLFLIKLQWTKNKTTLLVVIVMNLRLKNVIIMFNMLPGNLFQC